GVETPSPPPAFFRPQLPLLSSSRSASLPQPLLPSRSASNPPVQPGLSAPPLLIPSGSECDRPCVWPVPVKHELSSWLTPWPAEAGRGAGGGVRVGLGGGGRGGRAGGPPRAVAAGAGGRGRWAGGAGRGSRGGPCGGGRAGGGSRGGGGQTRSRPCLGPSA